MLFYTGRYYLAPNTAFLCLYTSASIKNRGCYCLIPSILPKPSVPAPASILNKRNLYWPYSCIQLQKHVSSSQFHSRAETCRKRLLWGVVLEGAEGCLKRLYLMMKTSTATILYLHVHISSFRQIGVYYKAMILELYILHAVGRVCMAICQFEGAGNVHTEERIFVVDIFIIK